MSDKEATLWVVSLLGEAVHHRRRHFRFRAEAAGAEAGVVGLRFGGDDDDQRH